MGLLGKVKKGVKKATRTAGSRVFRHVLKPTGKGVWRGMREYDERVLDPLGAALLQEGSKINEATYTLDFERLFQGKQPFVHGRRTAFGREITPRRIDYSEVAFGRGESREREQEKVRATFDEAGLAGEMIAKFVTDPMNLLVVKAGMIPSTVKGVRAGYRGAKGLVSGRKALAGREALLAENRALKTLVQEGRATPADESRLLEVRAQLQAQLPDLTETVGAAVRDASPKPVAGGAPVGDTLPETIPDLTELASTIASEQARETMILSSPLARPFRFITNRFVGSANTAKAEALDSWVALEAAKFEQFGAGTDIAAVLVDERMKALGMVAKFDNEAITLKSGVKATMREIMEDAGQNIKLSTEERAAVNTAKEARESIHNWGLNALENHYIDEGMDATEAAAKAADIIQETHLEAGQAYWPRMPAAIGESEQALRSPSFFRVGAQAPNLQLPRTAEFPGGMVRHSGDVGGVLSRYAQQTFYKVQQETVIKPLLKKLAIDPKTLTPTAFRATVDNLRIRRDWLKDVEVLLGKAPGLSPAQLQNRIGRLANVNIPEEWRTVLDRLQLGEILEAPTPRELAKRTRTAAGEAARAFEPSRPTPRLGKAAEAQIAAGKTTAGVKALKREIALMRKELKVLRGANDVDLKEAQRQLKVAERLARSDYRRLPLSEFPGITDVFEVSAAEKIEAAFSRLDPTKTPRFLAAINNWVGIGVGVQAGSFDVGFVTLQMWPGLLANPMAIPSVLMRMTNNKGYLGAMKALQGQTFRDGKPILQTFLAHDLRLVSEPLMPDIMMTRPGTITGKIGKTVTNWPLNRAFTRGINLARMNIAKHGVKLWEALRGRALTADEYRQIMRVANTVTGDFNWTRAGTGQVQRMLERVGLRYAPTWLRANLQWIATAAHPSMGVEANTARLALANTIGITVGLYAMTGLAIGQKPNLDPRDLGKFLTYRVAGMRVGPGGVLVQVTRTAAKAAMLADAALTAETKEEREAAARDLLDIREGKNPLRQFWRAGAPVIGGLIYDITANKGVQSYTQRKLDFSPAGAQAVGESLVLPFSAQEFTAQAEEGKWGASATGFFGTFLGGRSFPVSPPGLFMEAADGAAVKAGFPSWEKTPKATRAEIMRGSPELQAALQARDEYYERFPDQQSREDFVFGEVDKSRQASETTLLAMWKGVEAGQRDVVEFRQAFTDLMAKHGYLSSQLMDGLDPDLKRRSKETLGDYYARMYHSIQPEAFDGKAIPGDFPDGTIAPGEWEMWRSARESFWRSYPEARGHRAYIEEDYPTRNWESQEMADLHRAKNQMNVAYQAFLEIPKYRGLSADAGNFIDDMVGLADRKAREIRFALAQRGADMSKIRVPKKLAWRMVMEDLQGAQLSPEQQEWLGIAVLFSLKSKARKRMLSAERVQYLMDNRDLVQWYPSALGDAGLGDREVAILGLTGSPLGRSVQERVATAA